MYILYLYLYFYLYRFTASLKTILAFMRAVKQDLRKKLGNCPDQKGEGAVGTKSQLFLEILLMVPLLDIYCIVPSGKLLYLDFQ